MRRVMARVPVVDHFPVYGEDGFGKVSGLSQAAFSIVVFRGGDVAEVPVTISEIATSPGEYRLVFTPERPGIYEVEVAYAPGGQVYSGQYEVTEPVVVGGSRPPGWGS